MAAALTLCQVCQILAMGEGQLGEVGNGKEGGKGYADICIKCVEAHLQFATC